MTLCYRLDFTFRARPGWPPSAELIVFRETGDAILEVIKHYDIRNLDRIRLVNLEDNSQ